MKHPITKGSQEVPKECYICGERMLSATLTGSSTLTGAGGLAGMAPS
jgi:hypothetical protein